MLIVYLPSLKVNAASNLADTIDYICSNVNWADTNIRIQHAGVIFSKVSSPNYGLSYPDTDPVYTVWGGVLSQEDGTGGARADIAQSFAMTASGGLPVTYGSGFNVYNRFCSSLYDWLPSRWSKTTALAAMNSMVQSASNVYLIYTPPSGYYINNGRYYDEYIETADWIAQLGDLSKAETIFQWDYSSHWNGQYWGYAGTSGIECEAGPFAMIAARLYRESGNTLPNFNTVVQDLSYKFTANGWNSPLWAGSYVCTHYCDDRLRLQNTLAAWAALQIYYPLMSSSNQVNMIGMLTGGNKAWNMLLSSALYAAPKFREMTNDASVPATPMDTWSTMGLKCLFLMGIIPNTASLAIPLLESAYEDVETMFPATHFRFDYANHRIRIPVTAGTMSFQFGTATPSASFSSAGIYEVQFSSDWNTISSVNLVGSLNPSYLYLSTAGSQPPVQYGSVQVSGLDNGVAVPFQAWIDSGTPVNVPASGYTFTGVTTGSHTVHSLYNATMERDSDINVAASTTTPVSFDFSQPQPPPNNWFEQIFGPVIAFFQSLWATISHQVDPNVLFPAIGIGIFAGIVIGAVQWSHSRDLARKPKMKRRRSRK